MTKDREDGVKLCVFKEEDDKLWLSNFKFHLDSSSCLAVNNLQVNSWILGKVGCTTEGLKFLVFGFFVTGRGSALIKLLEKDGTVDVGFDIVVGFDEAELRHWHAGLEKDVEKQEGGEKHCDGVVEVEVEVEFALFNGEETVIVEDEEEGLKDEQEGWKNGSSERKGGRVLPWVAELVPLLGNVDAVADSDGGLKANLMVVWHPLNLEALKW